MIESRVRGTGPSVAEETVLYLYGLLVNQAMAMYLNKTQYYSAGYK